MDIPKGAKPAGQSKDDGKTAKDATKDTKGKKPKDDQKKAKPAKPDQKRGKGNNGPRKALKLDDDAEGRREYRTLRGLVELE